MTTLNDPTWTPTSKGSDPMRRALGDSIARVRRRLVARSVFRWVGALTGILALCVLLDRLIHFDDFPRWIMLAGLVWIMIIFYKRWISTARRVSPDPSDMALNISPQLHTSSASLAALVDLPATRDEEPIERALAIAIESRSSSHLDEHAAHADLRAGTLYEMLAVLIALSLIAIVSIRQPDLVSIGARRIAMPWTAVQWPQRFGITLPETIGHHPSDRAFIASAVIGPSSGDPDARVRWRLIGPGRLTNDTIIGWTGLALNAQGAEVSRDSRGRRYEQLLPVHTISAKLIPNGSILEYRIDTRDDRSDTRRVTIVHPPKLVRVTARITLPEYASELDETNASFQHGSHELSPASLALGPILAGSRIAMDWEFDTNVQIKGSGTPTSQIITTNHTLKESTTLSINPVDAYALSPRAPLDVFVRVVADAPPDATITSPVTDLVVGQRASIEINAHASDDLGLLESSVVVMIDDTTDATDAGDRVLTRRVLDSEMDADTTTMLELDSMGSAPGQTFELRALATDIRGNESRSPPRMVRVVEDREIVERVETQLGSISEILRRLDDQQRALLTQLREGTALDAADQSMLTEQISARKRSAEALRERLAQSRISDPQLTPMLEALDEALTSAEQRSQNASASIQREQDERAAEQMEGVRDDLGKAIAMLDRGQDTWLARRSIEELRSKVQGLLDETKQLASQTGGKPIEQLSEDERSTLQKILDKQRRVTQDARETIDQLDEQADALDKNNPTGAQGIRDAATQGRNSGIEEQLAQAGDELSQNQTSSATATQEQVLEELDKMLDQIEQAQRNRDSALRRKLASFMDSIKALIEDQTAELQRLDQQQAGLDQSMIVVRNNTLSVRDEASTAFPETQSIAESLTRATDAQSDAITALRGDPIDIESARQSQLAALTHLQAALEEAQRQDDQAAQRQAEQLRQQLRKSYQESLKEQSRISTETEPLIGHDLTRRQRASARQLGSDEDALRTALSNMLAETEELGEAPIFSLAHEQLDQLLVAASDALDQRSLDPIIVADQQGIATILTALIEVLGDPQQPQDDAFEDGNNSGGSGSGQGGGAQQPTIPPIAQLQLLRSLQQLTATQTRALSESDAPNPERIRKIGQMQRQLAEKGAQLIEAMNPQRPSDEQPSEDSPVDPVEETP